MKVPLNYVWVCDRCNAALDGHPGGVLSIAIQQRRQIDLCGSCGRELLDQLQAWGRELRIVTPR